MKLSFDLSQAGTDVPIPEIPPPIDPPPPPIPLSPADPIIPPINALLDPLARRFGPAGQGLRYNCSKRQEMAQGDS